MSSTFELQTCIKYWCGFTLNFFCLTKYFRYFLIVLIATYEEPIKCVQFSSFLTLKEILPVNIHKSRQFQMCINSTKINKNHVLVPNRT